MHDKLQIKELPWDTEFFGIAIGRLVVSDGVSASALAQALDETDRQLVYVYIAPGNSTTYHDVLAKHGGKPVESRICYTKRLVSGQMDRALSGVRQISPELESLAYTSGWLSRFNADEGLRPKFKALYYKWLEKDLNGGKVMVVSRDSKIEGMVTASNKDGKGKIGLMCVDESVRHHGVGT